MEKTGREMEKVTVMNFPEQSKRVWGRLREKGPK